MNSPATPSGQDQSCSEHFHAAFPANRSNETSSKDRFSSFRACCPLHSCQRRMITSQYRGSISRSRATRPCFAQAISVEPAPPKVSSTTSSFLLLFRIGYEIKSTGFIVGWSAERAGLSKFQTVVCFRLSLIHISEPTRQAEISY